MNRHKVKLIKVLGDQEDFADLIGTQGVLQPSVADGLVYYPNQRGDFLSLIVKRETTTGNEIKITTKLGNTFIFRLLEAT